MKYRSKKKGDQEKVQAAYELLLDLITKHQGSIDPSLWVGAMIAALAENFEASEVPFKFFKKEIAKACDHYKY